MIHSAIEKHMAYVQVTWPLQQFVATNPLWDVINHDVVSTAKHIAHHYQVSLTHTWREYADFYQQGTIGKQKIQEAILASPAVTRSSCSVDSVIMTDVIEHILHNFSDKMSDDANDKKRADVVLLSSQIDQHHYHGVKNAIQKKMVAIITEYLSMNDTSSTLFTWSKSYINLDKSLPEKTIDLMITSILSNFGVKQTRFHDYIGAIIQSMKGWFGYSKWQLTYPNHPYMKPLIKPNELVALWLIIEYECTRNYNNIAYHDAETGQSPNVIDQYLVYNRIGLDAMDIAWILQEALEKSQNEPLLHAIHSTARSQPSCHLDKSDCEAQLIFCMDTRSAMLRSAIEQMGYYQTLSTAGFFGFPLKVTQD